MQEVPEMEQHRVAWDGTRSISGNQV